MVGRRGEHRCYEGGGNIIGAANLSDSDISAPSRKRTVTACASMLQHVVCLNLAGFFFLQGICGYTNKGDHSIRFQNEAGKRYMHHLQWDTLRLKALHFFKVILTKMADEDFLCERFYDSYRW